MFCVFSFVLIIFITKTFQFQLACFDLAVNIVFIMVLVFLFLKIPSNVQANLQPKDSFNFSDEPFIIIYRLRTTARSIETWAVTGLSAVLEGIFYWIYFLRIFLYSCCKEHTIIHYNAEQNFWSLHFLNLLQQFLWLYILN